MSVLKLNIDQSRGILRYRSKVEDRQTYHVFFEAHALWLKHGMSVHILNIDQSRGLLRYRSKVEDRQTYHVFRNADKKRRAITLSAP